MALVSVNLPARRSKMAPRFIQQMTLQFLSTDIKEYINEVWKPFIKCYDFYLSWDINQLVQYEKRLQYIARALPNIKLLLDVCILVL